MDFDSMNSKFSIDAFNFNGDSRVMLIEMSRTAEIAERYEDMCQFMTKLVKLYPEHTMEERNLLSVAFKNVIGGRRNAWRSIKNYESVDSEEGVDANFAVYQKQIEDEIEQACSLVLELLENTLIKPDTKDEAQVFFLKMAGDYYRYLAESIAKEEHKSQTEKFYKQAMEMAMDTLPATSPIRLGLALNFSVCKYEILKLKEQACEMAKQSFDDAIAELDQLQEEDYKDSTLIMQLLRDNLTLWTAAEPDGDETVVEDLE